MKREVERIGWGVCSLLAVDHRRNHLGKNYSSSKYPKTGRFITTSSDNIFTGCYVLKTRDEIDDVDTSYLTLTKICELLTRNL